MTNNFKIVFTLVMIFGVLAPLHGFSADQPHAPVAARATPLPPKTLNMNGDVIDGHVMEMKGDVIDGHVMNMQGEVIKGATANPAFVELGSHALDTSAIIYKRPDFSDYQPLDHAHRPRLQGGSAVAK